MDNNWIEKELNHAALKKRQRQIRDTLPENLSLRIHRSLSWLHCAEEQRENADAEFIFLWIAFNAAYANEIDDKQSFGEKRVLLNFLNILVRADSQKWIYHIVWIEFPRSIRLLLSNRYVFRKFWDYQNQKICEQEWMELFEKGKDVANKALGHMDTVKVLAIVFDRLYTLRNQLIHGGATWNSSVNREQIRDGASFLRLLVPTIIYIMLNNQPAIIGQPCYPVVD
jgi:hypothetical protein